MQHETLTYQADGLTMRSQLFFEPASARRAGILVFPEAFGLGEHAISRAERLAKMGFVALACDLHGDGRVVDDLQEAIGLLQPLLADASRTRARATGALKALTGRSEVELGACGLHRLLLRGHDVDRASPSRRGREGNRRLP